MTLGRLSICRANCLFSSVLSRERGDLMAAKGAGGGRIVTDWCSMAGGAGGGFVGSVVKRACNDIVEVPFITIFAGTEAAAMMIYGLISGSRSYEALWLCTTRFFQCTDNQND